MNRKELIKFEKEIGDLYERAEIRTPIHLSCGSETKLMKIFRGYHQGDWVFSTHRSHYHWLLSGRSPKGLKKQILQGYSMHVFDDRLFTSAIVGGNTPIAMGVAMALKIKKSPNKVWCFLGDMAGETGIVCECIKYARGHNLPIAFVIEDNGYSVRAKTKETWGRDRKKVTKRYKYKRRYPHAGIGKYVMF